MQKRALLLLTLCALLLLAVTAVAMADAASRITWSLVGSGGGYSSSAHYQLQASIGQAAPGFSHSTHYQLGSGFLYVMGLPQVTETRLFLPVMLKRF